MRNAVLAVSFKPNKTAGKGVLQHYYRAVPPTGGVGLEMSRAVKDKPHKLPIQSCNH